MDYQEFLKTKVPIGKLDGFEPSSECPSWFKPHQVDCVHWAIRKGRAALFEAFGLGKTDSARLTAGLERAEHWQR